MLKSCDTFVALPPATLNGCVVFGKNADRPCDEVQEVVHVPATDHPSGAKLQCTYIEIDQVAHTHAVVLSKPAWMWGAEMGANEHGVCIGNEAVWTKVNSANDAEEKLLGMDLLRLGLERANTAKGALDVITHLLDRYGQGGNCSESRYSFTYHNSFLIADRQEAWLLETAGPHWAAEHIPSGIRNISNQLTIRTKVDACSADLKDFAKRIGWWNPDHGDFDFALVYSDDFEETELPKGSTPCSRFHWGKHLMQKFSENGTFEPKHMFEILRHEESGICMEGSFVAAGSQVSVLSPGAGKDAPGVHWFTATPNPCQSMYKPFLFCDGASVGDKTRSPTYGAEDPAKVVPRFQRKVDRQHALYKAHKSLRGMVDSASAKSDEIIKQMHELETHCLEDMSEIVKNFDDKSQTRVTNIFDHMTGIEINFYK